VNKETAMYVHTLITVLLAATPAPAATLAQASSAVEELPDPTPGRNKLDYFVGDWVIFSDDERPQSERSCRWNQGRYLLECASKSTASPDDKTEVLNFIAWDSVDKEYTNHLVVSSGRDEFLTGTATADGKTWKWKGDARWNGKTITNTSTFVQQTPSAYSSTSERWVDRKLISSSHSTAVKLPQVNALTGWTKERILFPLPFAKSIARKGLVDLRFAPGTFVADSEYWWSYGFVWWLEGEQKLDVSALKQDLKAYYLGLRRGSSTGPVEVVLSENPQTPDGKTTLTGQVTNFGKREDRQPGLLNVRVSSVWCQNEGRTAFVFEASPQRFESKIWLTLQSFRDGFRCHREGAVAP
jgi:hypothetical protein